MSDDANQIRPHQRKWLAGWSILVLVALAGRVEGQTQVPCRYEIAHIIQGPVLPPPTGAPSTIGTAISPNGRYVCGRFAYGIEEDRPFIFDTITEQFIAPGLPPGFYAASFADINDDAVAVGTGQRTDTGQRGFVFNLQSGQWTELEPLPGGLWSGATGINSSNVVCGWRSIGPGVNPQTAFRWSTGKGFEDLGLINDLSTGATRIRDDGTLLGWTGNSIFSPNTRVFYDHIGATVVLGPIPGGLNSTPQQINDSGRILLFGQYVQFGVTSPFLFKQGLMQLLPPFPGFDAASASVLDESDVAMGRSRTFTNPVSYRPTYWVNGVPYDLASLYPANSAFGNEGPVACSVVGELLLYSLSTSKSYVLAPIHRPPGDTNCDQHVNAVDLLNVINSWGQCDQCDSDLNSDGVVSLSDLMIVVLNWSP